MLTKDRIAQQIKDFYAGSGNLSPYSIEFSDRTNFWLTTSPTLLIIIPTEAFSPVLLILASIYAGQNEWKEQFTVEDLIRKTVKNNSLLPGVSIKKDPDSTRLILDQPQGGGQMTFHTLFPGMTLAYIHIDAYRWPEADSNLQIRPLLINYCISGRSELLLEDGSYIYLTENDICLSRQTAQNEYIFPAGHYEGIKIYFDTEHLSASCPEVLDAFGIDLTSLEADYCRSSETDSPATYLCETDDTSRRILKKMWDTADDPSDFTLKLCTFELLHHFLQQKPHPARLKGFFTETQVAIAKKAREILVSDLRRHYPIRLLAEQFSVSETSLKNYFRGVYGQNISSYLRETRMNAAAKLLADTQYPVAEISVRVGYSNQGKFAAAFREQFHMKPLEYRRQKRLEDL